MSLIFFLLNTTPTTLVSIFHLEYGNGLFLLFLWFIFPGPSNWPLRMWSCTVLLLPEILQWLPFVLLITSRLFPMAYRALNDLTLVYLVDLTSCHFLLSTAFLHTGFLTVEKIHQVFALQVLKKYENLEF